LFRKKAKLRIEYLKQLEEEKTAGGTEHRRTPEETTKPSIQKFLVENQESR